MIIKNMRSISKYIGLASLAGIGYAGYYLFTNHAVRAVCLEF